MDYRDPNRPEPGNNLRDAPRDLGKAGTGDFAHDGFTVLARRPRAPFTTDIVPAAEADRVESMYASFDIPDYGD